MDDQLWEAKDLWEANDVDAATESAVVFVREVTSSKVRSMADVEARCRALVNTFTRDCAALVEGGTPRELRSVLMILANAAEGVDDNAQSGGNDDGEDGAAERGAKLSWRAATLACMVVQTHQLLAPFMFSAKFATGVSWAACAMGSVSRCLSLITVTDASASVDVTPNAAAAGSEEATDSAQGTLRALQSSCSAGRWLCDVITETNFLGHIVDQVEGAAKDPATLATRSRALHDVLALIGNMAACWARAADGPWRLRDDGGDGPAAAVQALQRQLDVVEERDSERVALTDRQLEMIRLRRRRAREAIAQRSAAGSGGSGCCGAHSNGGAAAEVTLADWEAPHWTAPESTMLECLRRCCSHIASARHLDAVSALGLQAVGDAVAHTAAASLLVSWAEQAYAPATAEGGARATHDDHRPEQSRRDRRYAKWATSRQIGLSKPDAVEGTLPPLPHPASLNSEDPSTVARAMHILTLHKEATQRRQACLVTLCSSSDDEDGGDDDDEAIVDTSGPDTLLLDANAHPQRKWLPSLHPLGVLRLQLFTTQGEDKGNAKNSSRLTTPTSFLEERLVPCMAALRSNTAAAVAVGLVELGRAVLQHPRYTLCRDEASFAEAVAIPKSKRDDTNASPDSTAVNDAEIIEHYIAWCDSPVFKRFFLVSQEVVNVMVSCPVEELRKLATDLLPSMLWLFGAEARLRLIAALILRCPYTSAASYLLQLLKRFVEIDVADAVKALTAAVATGSPAEIRAVALQRLVPPLSSCFLQPLVPRVCVSLLKTWSATSGAIDRNGDQIIAVLNVLRFLLVCDKRQLCGAMFRPENNTLNSYVAQPPAASLPPQLPFPASRPEGCSEVATTAMDSAGRGAVLPALTAALGGIKAFVARPQQASTTLVELSTAGSSMALFSLNMAVEGVEAELAQ